MYSAPNGGAIGRGGNPNAPAMGGVRGAGETRGGVRAAVEHRRGIEECAEEHPPDGGIDAEVRRHAGQRHRERHRLWQRDQREREADDEMLRPYARTRQRQRFHCSSSLNGARDDEVMRTSGGMAFIRSCCRSAISGPCLSPAGRGRLLMKYATSRHCWLVSVFSWPSGMLRQMKPGRIVDT